MDEAITKKVGFGKVDETISAIEGGWEFTPEVAEQFDSHARKSIPLYEEIQDMTVNISEWFIQNSSIVYDLGSSTGETIFRLQKKHVHKHNVRYIGIDNSAMMVRQAMKKTSSHNTQFLCQDILQTKFERADLFLALFTMQFSPIQDRIQLLQSIYNNLNSAGALIIVEKILAEEGRFFELWTELYWDFKRKQGLTDDQILQKARSIRGVLRPLTLNQNIDLLKSAGFTCIDLFFKWYNFAGILAIKTIGDTNHHLTAGGEAQTHSDHIEMIN